MNICKSAANLAHSTISTPPATTCTSVSSLATKLTKYLTHSNWISEAPIIWNSTFSKNSEQSRRGHSTKKESSWGAIIMRRKYSFSWIFNLLSPLSNPLLFPSRSIAFARLAKVKVFLRQYKQNTIYRKYCNINMSITRNKK